MPGFLASRRAPVSPRDDARPALKTGDIYRGAIPFVFIQLLALGLLATFPQLATWLPGALYP